MIGKSLAYAYPRNYAGGGGVDILPAGLADPNIRLENSYTPEQLAIIEDAQRRTEEARASSAASQAELARIHAENPDVDFSEEGQARARAEAEAYLASLSPEELARHRQLASESITTYQPPSSTERQNTATYDQFYQQPDRAPTSPAPNYNVGMGDVASAFAREMGYLPPEANTYDFTVRAPEGGAYVPPVQQGLGSMRDSVFDGYLMYSRPTQDVFIRPGG